MPVSSVTYSPYSYGFENTSASQVNTRSTANSQPGAASASNPASSTPVPGNSESPAPGSVTQGIETSENTGSTESRTDSGPNAAASSGQPGQADQALSQAEKQLVQELETIDTRVRQHEMAHIAAGGRYITSAANFTYRRGPDGVNYAVGGEVGIDTSPVPGDPEATLQKMRQIKNAALAPANPSAQDLKVASEATSMSSKALSDLMLLRAQEQARSSEDTAFGGMKNAADSYEKVSNLPEKETSTIQIAV